MKNLILSSILVSLPLLLGGCGVEEPVVEVKPESDSVNTEELEERESIWYLKDSETPYTGKVYEFYENGQKKEEGNYKDGKGDGLNFGWHENGQKKGEATYKDGKMISEKYWNSKGEPVDTYEEAIK